MKKSLRILIYLGLITCLIAVLAAILVPRFTGLQFDPVVGHSMEPTIVDGALVAIGQIDPAQIKVGDIIGFGLPEIDMRVCHRVIGIVQTDDGYGFVTKGDNNPEPDDWVISPQNVFGKVYFDTSRLAPLTNLMRTPRGFTAIILLISLAAMGLVAIEIRLISKRTRVLSPKS
jgi:signal peptidase